MIQGQLGELLLFHFIQRLQKAIPLLRKMKITTSNKHERFGADAIHFKYEQKKPIIILGEAKTYTSEYKFNEAFTDAIISILNTYKNQLNIMLSECDSGESDVKHALERYKEIHNGKKPQAHKVAKLGYLLDDLRDKHKKIKQCIRYIEVMQDAINNSYTIEKLKLELSKVKSREYNGRTKYWQIAQEILED